MSASLSESAAPLRLDARQRDILAYIGLPMQGWPIASLDAQTPAARQGLVVDTMDPAVRSLRLIDLKKGDDSSVLPIEKIGEKTPNSSVNSAWAAPEKRAKSTVEASLTSAAAVQAGQLRLWSLDGVEQTAKPEGAGKLLLLLEYSAAQSDFPLSPDALLLLRHILAALQWPPENLSLCALRQEQAQPASWSAQLAAWQPALVLVLGRNASRAVLGEQLQLQTGSLSSWRGQKFDIAGIAARVSYPLDYLLRKPQAKAGAWQDWLTAKWQWDEVLAAQNEKRLNS